MKITKSQVGLILSIVLNILGGFGIVPPVAPGKVCPEIVAE